MTHDASSAHRVCVNAYKPLTLLLRATWCFSGFIAQQKSRRICLQKSLPTACLNRCVVVYLNRNLFTKPSRLITLHQGGRLPSHQFNMLLISFARRVTQTPSVAEVLFLCVAPLQRLFHVPATAFAFFNPFLLAPSGISAASCLTARICAAAWQRTRVCLPSCQQLRPPALLPSQTTKLRVSSRQLSIAGTPEFLKQTTCFVSHVKCRVLPVHDAAMQRLHTALLFSLRCPQSPPRLSVTISQWHSIPPYPPF